MIGGSVRGAAGSGAAAVEERVRVRLTVADPARAGAVADVEVSAAAGTPLRAVRGQLLAAVALTAGGDVLGTPLFVDGARVDDEPIGLPPLLTGALVTVGRAGGSPGRAAGTSGGITEVHVISGPDAGGRHPVVPGVTRVGRSDDVGLRLADPDVSRAHAEIEIAGPLVRVRDLGSTNGTRIGSVALGRAPSTWGPGEAVHVGGTQLLLRAADADPAGGGGPAATTPDGGGHLLVNPAPRLAPPAFAGEVTFPNPPAENDRPRLPWVGVVLPLLLSLPLAWLLRQAVFAAFALLSPTMMITQHLLDRRGRSRERVETAARHAEQVGAASAELDGLLAAERARLLLDRLDPAAVGAVAAGPLQRLWERHQGDGDELVLRLGLGDLESVVQVHGRRQGEDRGPGGTGPPVLTDAPVALDLGDPAVGGVAGLVGPRPGVLALARSLIGQAAVANSPRLLRIAVLATAPAAADEWGWVSWLPHAVGDLVSAAGEVAPDGPPGPGCRPGAQVRGPRAGRPSRLLLVLDGAAQLRRDPQVVRLLAVAGDGVTALCLDDDEARLPAECGATVVVAPTWAGTARAGTATLAVRGRPPRTFRPDLVSPGWAERLGRDLARLADATPAAADRGLPARVRLADLLAPGPRATSHVTTASPADTAQLDPRLAPAVIARGWARRRDARERATTTVAGVTAAGPWRVDLARDGPHALVAGTTGAGKSELLTSLVTALAVTHPPDRLHLLLVDYKGGTAFGPLGDLPHTAGVLTDLDARLARRALSSLHAELRRRERLLRRLGVADVDGYECRRAASAEPLPRLVVVVDEFRVLSEELPELLTGLVRVAVVGRSLGVHLVLATQRPAGVVTAELRANVNLRIALRVRDRADSDDVVDAPDAAAIPADRPGRGVFRSGNGPLVEFQSALAGGPPAAASGPAVRRIRRDDRLVTAWRPGEPLVGPGDPSAGRAGAGLGRVPGPDHARDGEELGRIVRACREAARLGGFPEAHAPWLPPLPEVIRPQDLPRLLVSPLPPAPPTPRSSGEGRPEARAPGTAPPGSAVPGSVDLTFGVVDVPEAQARTPLMWRLPAEGHLAVVGAPGSGRTGTLRALAGAAARAPRPVHVHVVDGGGRLADLDGLPHVGTVVPVGDVERAARLLGRLSALVRRPVRHVTEPGSIPPVLLLVDGWEQLLETWSPIDHGRLVDDLVRLARDGSGTGLRLVVSGGRAVLSGPVSGLLTERLLLRAADPTDLVLAGVPAAEVPSWLPPGRVLRLLAGGRTAEAQVLLDGAGERPRTARPSLRPPPLRLPPLPEELSTATLLEALRRGTDTRPDTAVAEALAAGTLPLGLGGDDVSPLGPSAAGPGWLVAGRPGSGRSTTLTTAARILRTAGRPVVLVTGPGSALARVATGSTGHGPDPDRGPGTGPPGSGSLPPAVLAGRGTRADGAQFLTLLDRHPDATLIVDDVTLLTDTCAEEVILARLDAVGIEPGPGRTATAPGTTAAGRAGSAAGSATTGRRPAEGSPSDGSDRWVLCRWPAGPGPHVLAGTTPGQAALAFRGLAARLRSTGSGVLLQPEGPGDGEAFGVRVAVVPGGPPGRAVLMRDGRAIAVQVARCRPP